MTRSERSWIGADPGGKGNFGIAILSPEETIQTFTVNCADEAVDVALRIIRSEPSGIGVDAPLWWSSGRSSDRCADRWIRETYKLSGGQVQAGNSLRGAALIQGPMFVSRLRQHFPDIPATEAHPKALLTALKCTWPEFQSRFGVIGEAKDEHQRDAIIAAVAAREGFECRWLRDLSTDRLESEQNPQDYWLSPTHYFWPGW